MLNTESEKILIRHLRDLPYFRAMLRAVEDKFYQDLQLPSPVLDMGCGDGHFASVAFSHPLDVGLDPWTIPLKEAHQRGSYRMVLQADGAQTPFPDNWFGSVISNSVLEHIPHVDLVVMEIGRILRPGGLFVFCVPNDRFDYELEGTTLFRRLGMISASKSYSHLFDRIARHVHLDSQDVWKQRLACAGFKVERCWDYFPPNSLHVLEVGHFFGLPSLFVHWLSGRWILIKNNANLWLPWLITHNHVLSPVSERGVCTFYVTRKEPYG